MIRDLPAHFINDIATFTGKEVFEFHKADNLNLAEVEILITYGVQRDWQALDLNELKRLQWVQIFQTGVENLPFAQLHEKNITVTNVKGIYGTPISEYVISHILYQAKEIERYIEHKKKRQYDRTELLDEIAGKTLGIFGTGTIGQAVAKKAKAFDMHVVGFNSNARPVEYFDQTYSWEDKHHMLQMCDYIVLLLPLIDKTRNFLSFAEFKQMKRNAYIINVGRGGLIDEDALIDALENDLIRGATLDVFTVEPLPKDSRLWDVEKIIITPHISGKTKYFYERVVNIFKENYKRYERGEPLTYVVDLEKKY